MKDSDTRIYGKNYTRYPEQTLKNWLFGECITMDKLPSYIGDYGLNGKFRSMDVNSLYPAIIRHSGITQEVE